MTPDMLADLLATLRTTAERARFDADLYAEHGTKGGVAPGTHFYRRGGVDACYLAELRRKADDAERAVRDCEQIIEATR
jgi:hypothetical protein